VPRVPAVQVDASSGFGLDHLPLGVFSTPGEPPRVGARIGEQVLDLAPVAAALGLPVAAALALPTLNPFLALGRAHWSATRAWLLDLLAQDAAADLLAPHLRRLDDVRLHLPVQVGDYVDFYASQAHATNVGAIFRPDGQALPAAWKHLPIGYHGRAGTVVVSGTDVVRPRGLRVLAGDLSPTYGPTTRLDLEAELAFVVGTPSALGAPVGVDAFDEHVFGVALLDDWSARDVQSFEYRPLGPFLGKSFATSLAAWVTPLEALAAARTDLPHQLPEPARYLRGNGSGLFGLDLQLEVLVNGTVVSRPPYASTYWSPAQLLAHLSANGASVRTGDLFASGTVSGPDPDQVGSLLELSHGGVRPFTLDDGSTRTFLRDGDTAVVRASAPSTSGGRLSLGEVSGRVRPAR
jgi:fumarylacetoacetase